MQEWRRETAKFTKNWKNKYGGKNRPKVNRGDGNAK